MKNINILSEKIKDCNWQINKDYCTRFLLSEKINKPCNLVFNISEVFLFTLGIEENSVNPWTGMIELLKNFTKLKNYMSKFTEEEINLKDEQIDKLMEIWKLGENLENKLQQKFPEAGLILKWLILILEIKIKSNAAKNSKEKLNTISVEVEKLNTKIKELSTENLNLKLEYKKKKSFLDSYKIKNCVQVKNVKEENTKQEGIISNIKNFNSINSFNVMSSSQRNIKNFKKIKNPNNIESVNKNDIVKNENNLETKGETYEINYKKKEVLQEKKYEKNEIIYLEPKNKIVGGKNSPITLVTLNKNINKSEWSREGSPKPRNNILVVPTQNQVKSSKELCESINQNKKIELRPKENKPELDFKNIQNFNFDSDHNLMIKSPGLNRNLNLNKNYLYQINNDSTFDYTNLSFELDEKNPIASMKCNFQKERENLTQPSTNNKMPTGNFLINSLKTIKLDAPTHNSAHKPLPSSKKISNENLFNSKYPTKNYHKKQPSMSEPKIKSTTANELPNFVTKNNQKVLNLKLIQNANLLDNSKTTGDNLSQSNKTQNISESDSLQGGKVNFFNVKLGLQNLPSKDSNLQELRNSENLEDDFKLLCKSQNFNNPSNEEINSLNSKNIIWSPTYSVRRSLFEEQLAQEYMINSDRSNKNNNLLKEKQISKRNNKFYNDEDTVGYKKNFPNFFC
jgi:regulator of replication initiation timing